MLNDSFFIKLPAAVRSIGSASYYTLIVSFFLLFFFIVLRKKWTKILPSGKDGLSPSTGGGRTPPIFRPFSTNAIVGDGKF
jgi:hypothetical protein